MCVKAIKVSQKSVKGGDQIFDYEILTRTYNSPMIASTNITP